VWLASSHQGAEGGSGPGTGTGTGTGSESYLGHRGHRVSVPNISTRVVTQSLLNNRVCKIRRILFHFHCALQGFGPPHDQPLRKAWFKANAYRSIADDIYKKKAPELSVQRKNKSAQPAGIASQ
jgi:hypothetical protein